MARVGILNVQCYVEGEGDYNFTYKIIETEVAGDTLVGYRINGGNDSRVTWCYDVDVSTTTDLDKMFQFGGTNTYTWLTAMTEVEDDSLNIEFPISIANGGTGATTAAQALTNLGAASVIALDALSATVSGKANASHEHTGYATTADVDVLEDALSAKADANHTHTDYAASSHDHDGVYYTETEIDSMVSTINASISDKANSSHTHTIADITNLQSELDSIEDAIDGKADINHAHSDYSLNTHNHDGVYAEASHTHNYAAVSHDHSVATTAANGFMSVGDKVKLDGVETGANVNQNAFSNVIVGSTTIAADAEADTLTLIAGSNVTLTPDATNDKITISSQDTVYAHPSYTARTGVPASNQTPGFGGTFNVTQPVSDGSGHITAMNSRTVTIPSTAATTSAAGLMSAADKTKLNGIATGANAYTLPTAGSSLGGVKTTSTVTSTSGYTACPIISGVPYYKDTNTTYSLSSFGVTATASELNKLDGCTATVTELNYVDGVTSNIQTQLNNKAASNHTHTASCCTITGSSSSQSLTAGTMTRVSLNTFSVNTDSSCFSVYDNGVKVAKAGYYQISGSAYITCSATSGIRVIHIHQNSTEIATVRSEEGGSYASQGGIATAPKVVYLNAGDVIYLKVRSMVSAGTLVPNNCATYLSIVKM